MTRIDYGWMLKFEGTDLPPYPIQFQVDFSNDPTNAGTSKSQLGTVDGVEIPQEYLIPGKSVYAYVYYVDEEYVYGRTEYVVEIPVEARPSRTDEQPTPTQQTVIDETIAALNAAVSEANAAIEHYPMITGGVWYVWDVTAGEYVSTGVPATGADGFSPYIAVTKITGGHRVTVTDAQGPHTFDVIDGAPGTPGTDGTSAYVWIRYASAQPTQDADMKTTPDAWIGIYAGDAATAPTTYTSYTWYKIKGDTGPAGAVQDVQVNGVSVLQDGVANVPIMGTGILGVARVISTNALGIGVRSWDNKNGYLTVMRPLDSQIKEGVVTGPVITPYQQHLSTFYGLAKIAGANENNSTLVAGVYSEAAKSKISDMLNAPVSVSGSTPSITAMSGVRYVCGEVSTLAVTAPASGCVDIVFESGSTATVLTVTSAKSGVSAIKWANGWDETCEANTRYEILVDDGEWGIKCEWT